MAYIARWEAVNPVAPYTNTLTSIPPWISNHNPSEAWDANTYEFLNFSVATVEVWECSSGSECISNNV